MNNASIKRTESARRPSTASLVPSTLILLAINLFPLVGVALWGWDAFLLLILYWMETVIVAFWTIVQIALSPPGTAGKLKGRGRRRVSSSLAVAGFFTVHAGIFIGVHFGFLWIIFSGDWSQRTGGLGGFLKHAIGTQGLWLPLAVLFIARGWFVLVELLPERLALLLHVSPSNRPQTAPQTAEADAKAKAEMDAILLGLYGRIFAMQVAIIFGGWLAMSMGTMAPLILLVLCKTAAEVCLHLGFVPKIERPDGD
jgi:hypothetical protein